jgi:hypothetical protein
MGLHKDIKALESRTFILAFFSLLFLISPGIAVIYLYLPALFHDLEWVKLILLSVAFTSPFVFLNTTLIAAYEQGMGNKEDFFTEFCMGAVMTGLLIYLLIIASYILDRTFSHIIYALLAIEVLCVGAVMIHGQLRKQ